MSNATSKTPRRARDFEPYAAQQGIDHYVAGNKAGVAVQSAQYVFAAGGVVTFSSLGLQNMATTSYQVFLTNHTGSGAPQVANSDRLTTQITIKGASVADVIDILIVGRFNGMAGI